MTASTSEVGYTPTFHMPIIGLPPADTEPESYYEEVLATTALDVTPAANAGLEITLVDPAYRQLFAVAGGLVTFIPPETPLPTLGAEPSPGAGSLVLQTWAVDVNELKKILSPGVPPMTSVLYLNVNPDSVRTGLDPWVRAQTEPVLLGAWNLPSPPADRTQLENNFLDRLMLGEAMVFVPGGAPLGEAELVDPTDPTSAIISFTLRFTDGAGDDLSPILHLLGMPGYANPQWTNHPLPKRLANKPVPVDIYLKFEVWREGSQIYEPVAPGIPVDLIDHDPSLLDDDVLDTQNTDPDGNGTVHFSFPNLHALADGERWPDLFFRVRHTGPLYNGGPTLPGGEWSTSGWKDTTGQVDGYQKQFVGTKLGSAAAPVVFRIGLDVHLKLEYLNGADGIYSHAPQGIPVKVWAAKNTSHRHVKELCTDEIGETHGLIFDIHGGETVYFEIPFEMEDLAINLPKAKIDFSWRTDENDADRTPSTYYPDNERTSIGDWFNPAPLQCQLKYRNAALFILTRVRELSSFLFHIISGAWQGITNLSFDIDEDPAGGSYANESGFVRITPADHWKRDAIMHELGHQLMYKEADWSSLEYIPTHHAHSLSDPKSALLEGWAEFIGELLNRGRLPYELHPILDLNENEVAGGLGPPPYNRGESVEGAFANGLWGIFRNHVCEVSTDARMQPYVASTESGNVTDTTSWVQDPEVKTLFMSMIWRPLQNLKTIPNPTSTDMIAQIKQENPDQWHKLQAELQDYNMAMTPPTVNEVVNEFPYSNSGPATGGTLIKIKGAEFVFDRTWVTIAGVEATSVEVTHTTELTAFTPAGAAGPANVIVRTPAGPATLFSSFTYHP